ncbi:MULTISPECIES: DUF4267 domain-containing protein [Streptomyces]|uniref:DUF4267 domain-containing protein n=1 Tax=Streptomyces andamanensis TaxID=1565035 RepID=A0ABV8TLC1_9ACTN|nr:MULTISPECIES: DUF4267 domain-containing protein [unclassified Streptomyces]ANH93554.1 hypothetical protein A8713_22280 [Streptomyces sp. SAT1]EYT83743.1 membrane protein [Streptomyces sp. Tu 6176]MYR56646.1 DUF4267 domain-containing protein [Streptomyces sp. SID625]
MTVTAYTLAVVLDLFCVFLGYRFLFQPGPAAAGYGVPADPSGDAGAYLTIKGLRDGTLGVVGLALLAFAGAGAEAWFLLCVALVPLGDTLIVLRHGGTKAVAFGIHFATAVVVLIGAGLLFAL